MLISVGEPSTKPAAGEDIAGIFKTVAILRIGAGLTLAFFHAWQAAIGAYYFIWKEQPWNWVTVLTEARIPMPHLTAPLAATLVAAVALCWTVGFLTRLFSVIFIPVAVGALVVAQRLDPPLAESCWLYLVIAATLVLFGSGNVSVDWFFQLGRRKKEPARRW